MKILLRLLLKSQHQRKQFHETQTEKGMTLIELLIGTVMAFLIITPMLGFVVDMLNTDRREQVKSNTEQDIQAAVDFIAQDLSQAIYIYDNNLATTNTATGIPAIRTFLPVPPDQNNTPILVFWKRQQLKNSLPITAGDAPSSCAQTTIPSTPAPLTGTGACNDTYVLSLVAYYQVKGDTGVWCQPSGDPNTCPTRIVRYQIQDGLKNPAQSANLDPAARYFTDAQLGNDRKDGLKRSNAFNIGTTAVPGFDINNPTERVTNPGVAWERNDVLVNYLDHTNPGPPPTQCTTALGNPTTQVGTQQQPIPEDQLKIHNPNNTSFYACVDTSKNLARVTIRGNSLRRLQPNGADYAESKSAFFPTATVQVQGLGARGK
ncbi:MULTISPECIES: hormogonium polysaccharide secretion pseudopilin HpsC [unclassified Microcoleus]|uniref:hormogonium polysaccharide secretion pseudopilin HpsC n=1 Tax=unclassified Microcoleus TaxID=2642155 RepID=UPI0025E050DC|nr:MULTISPECIES: hormogonium polysaccharide secretion pseudopilin HpsC [unclassified Microcoleus]